MISDPVYNTAPNLQVGVFVKSTQGISYGSMTITPSCLKYQVRTWAQLMQIGFLVAISQFVVTQNQYVFR